MILYVRLVCSSLRHPGISAVAAPRRGFPEFIVAFQVSKCWRSASVTASVVMSTTLCELVESSNPSSTLHHDTPCTLVHLFV